MNRRELLQKSLTAGLAAGIPSLTACNLLASNGALASGADKDQRVTKPNPLAPPAKGPIPVAFLISDGAVVIDFCGPWEVFQDVHTAKGEGYFRLYTVAETTKPVTASAGLKIVPDYSLQT